MGGRSTQYTGPPEKKEGEGPTIWSADAVNAPNSNWSMPPRQLPPSFEHPVKKCTSERAAKEAPESTSCFVCKYKTKSISLQAIRPSLIDRARCSRVAAAAAFHPPVHRESLHKARDLRRSWAAATWTTNRRQGRQIPRATHRRRSRRLPSQKGRMIPSRSLRPPHLSWRGAWSRRCRR